MAEDFLLLTPGPTPLAEEVMDALKRPILHHRTPQFQAILQEVAEGLKKLFRTQETVYLMAASGTGAMETAVANLISAGDTAIVIRGGKFGERWGELVEAYGGRAVAIDVTWGQAASPEEIEKVLKANPTAKAVFTTLLETSTGVRSDIKGYAQVTAKTSAVLVVDAISGVGCEALETDQWGIDCVVSGSQKGLMLPPGLAFITLSQKAWKQVEAGSSPRYYFSLPKMKKVWEKKQDTPFTPAIGLIVALSEALKLLLTEGVEQVLARHGKNAEAVRSAMAAMGLEVFSDASCTANGVTAVKVPDGVDGKKLVKMMRDEHGIMIAGGQAELAGKIFRVASMGAIRAEDLRRAIGALEEVLTKLGWKFPQGAGQQALDGAIK